MTTDFANIAELQERLGGIPPERIRLHPPPGTATERDVVRVHDLEGRTCELIDGVLVYRAGTLLRGLCQTELVCRIMDFPHVHDLGIEVLSNGPFYVAADRILAADVAFISWDRIPGRRIPREPVARIVPDLTIEILTEGNTIAEMERKLRDYFEAGVRLVWLIDPPTRTATIHTAPNHCESIPPNGSIDGGDVLPGFTLSLRELFDNAEAVGPQ
ncbi:MAG: Uma2 family endonuclease [Planctomycetaceae bacterium]